MQKGLSMSRSSFLFMLSFALSVGCQPKTDASTASTADAGATATPIAPRAALPPEPAPPVADKASEVPDLEAKLAADKTYAAVWTGPRADLNAFLAYESELLATGGAPAALGSTIKGKKLQDAGIKLFMVFARVGKFPDDFAKKLATHLDATKAEPHAGTWSTFTKGGPTHDHAALAAWSRPEDAALLREHIASRKAGAGPFGWESWQGKGNVPRPWLVDEGAALDRLAIVGKLTPEEEQRRETLRAVAKKEAAAKAEMASAVSVGPNELFAAYQANEVSADDKYKGKKLLVSGTVSSIDKGGITGEAILLKLATPNEFMPVTASIDDEEKPKTAKLAKGDQVRVFCTGGAMKVIGLIQLSECTLR